MEVIANKISTRSVKLKRIYLSIFLGSMFANLALAEVNLEDLNNIRDLVKNEQYELALQKHVWFHEESKSSSGMGGVRLSYAIMDWVELGNKYPPALSELRRIRDENQSEMSSGKGTFNNFHDFSSINEQLGDEIKTIELFSSLSKNYPTQAKRLYHVVEDLLIEKKEFKLVDKYMEDPIFKYETLRHSREQSLSYARKNPNRDSSISVEYNDNLFIDKTITLINALLKLDKKSEAIEIHQRATRYFQNKKLESIVIPRP